MIRVIPNEYFEGCMGEKFSNIKKIIKIIEDISKPSTVFKKKENGSIHSG